MNCKLAEQNLALWVGGDLDEASIRDLEEHLALCSHCRAAGRRLKSAQRVLVKASHVETTRSVKSRSTENSTTTNGGQTQLLRSLDESIWPNVSRGLRALEARKRKQRFNGWIPAAAVIAACLAIILSPRSSEHGPRPSRDSIPGATVDGQNWSGFDPIGLSDESKAMWKVSTGQVQTPRESQPARSDRVNGSVGKFGPGLRNLIDERPFKK
ncbi:MAG: zf-HC2 domain-containing protein [Planctomycetota bacterium]|nr:zf-HC2 domain-containing protein [Planctomycetota bacterium]MDA1212364.1 zf-HC2 domain-containing protein [Planctomycetota bacterium]